MLHPSHASGPGGARGGVQACHAEGPRMQQQVIDAAPLAAPLARVAMSAFGRASSSPPPALRLVRLAPAAPAAYEFSHGAPTAALRGTVVALEGAGRDPIRAVSACCTLWCGMRAAPCARAHATRSHARTQLFGAALEELFGVTPLHSRPASGGGHADTEYMWGIGFHPFGPFATSSLELSEVSHGG